MRKTILACAVVALIASATTATAATLITSEDIKNGTIQASDIKKGAISENRLSDGVRDQRAVSCPACRKEHGQQHYCDERSRPSLDHSFENQRSA